MGTHNDRSGRILGTAGTVARAWVEKAWRAVSGHPLLERYRAELEGALEAPPAGLSSESRRERSLRLAGWSATFVQGLPVNLLPLLYPSIMMAMVQGIARLHGVTRTPLQVALELLGTLGGGFVLRLALRFRPLLLGLSAANSGMLTLAIARFALWYYGKRGGAERPEAQKMLTMEMQSARAGFVPKEIPETHGEHPNP